MEAACGGPWPFLPGSEEKARQSEKAAEAPPAP